MSRVVIRRLVGLVAVIGCTLFLVFFVSCCRILIVLGRLFVAVKGQWPRHFLV